jgi:hypothetical protein
VVWIPVLVWVGAVVVAAIVLGFAGYEIWWKARRLQGDLQRLTVLGDELSAVRRELTAAQRRMVPARTDPHPDPGQ